VAHNVLYVATMSDTLYGFDVDVGGAPLWTRDLAALVGATPVPIAKFAISGATVSFGGSAATSVVVVNARKITARTPPHKKGPVNVVVTDHPDAHSSTLSGGFTYHHQHRFAVLRLALRLLPTLRRMYFALSTA
jgi:IPT/TIG domain